MTPFPRADYRPLEPYAPDRRPVPVDLSDNTNRWGAHPAALKTLRAVGDDDLTRYPPVYADALRAALSERFEVPADRIVTGCGSDDLLDSAFRACGLPGERIAYLVPTFSMVEIFARMNGLETLPVLWEEGVAEPTRLLDGKPSLIYLCSPNNPTGLTLDREWVLELLRLVGPDGPPVLLDEAYADYASDVLLATAVDTERLLVLRTLSKAYGLAGLRVGFAVGPAEVVSEVRKSRGPYKVSRPAEAAAIAALGSPGWVEEVVAETVTNRARLAAALSERGFEPLPSAANYLLVPVADTVTTTAGLRERGVAVRPFPQVEGLGDAIRVSVGPWPMVERFLEALDGVRAR